MRKLPSALTDARSIRRNQRFATYEARLDGRRVFVKQAATASMAESLRREIWGLETFGSLAKVAEFPFEVPQVLIVREDLVTTTWAPGVPTRLTKDGEQRLATAESMAEIYAAIDRATALAGRVTSSFSVADSRGADEADRLGKVLNEVDYDSRFDRTLIKDTLGVITKGFDDLEARLTHADLVPPHVLRTRSGKLTLIDFDSCSMLWPRFYDVVNCAFNMALVDTVNVDFSRALITNFFEAIDEDVERHAIALNTIAGVRAVSSCYEYMSQPNALHNTSQTLTEDRAEAITDALHRIVSGQLFLEI